MCLIALALPADNQDLQPSHSAESFLKGHLGSSKIPARNTLDPQDGLAIEMR